MKTNSIGINKVCGNEELELVAQVGSGDTKMILWRRANGLEVIETNADPIWEGEEGFDEAREKIVG